MELAEAAASAAAAAVAAAVEVDATTAADEVTATAAELGSVVPEDDILLLLCVELAAVVEAVPVTDAAIGGSG